MPELSIYQIIYAATVRTAYKVFYHIFRSVYERGGLLEMTATYKRTYDRWSLLPRSPLTLQVYTAAFLDCLFSRPAWVEYDSNARIVSIPGNLPASLLSNLLSTQWVTYEKWYSGHRSQPTPPPPPEVSPGMFIIDPEVYPPVTDAELFADLHEDTPNPPPNKPEDWYIERDGDTCPVCEAGDFSYDPTTESVTCHNCGAVLALSDWDDSQEGY